MWEEGLFEKRVEHLGFHHCCIFTVGLGVEGSGGHRVAEDCQNLASVATTALDQSAGIDPKGH